MSIRLPGLRYTKITLLVFGLGLVAGFVVVVGEFWRFGRVASVMMAVPLALLPVALFADGPGMTLLAWVVARLSGGKRVKSRVKSRPAASRRKPPARSAARAPRRKRR